MKQEYIYDWVAKLLVFLIRVSLLTYIWNSYITEEIFSYKKFSFIDMSLIVIFIELIFNNKEEKKD